MAQVIAIVSQKGGVGKTTTAANLAAALAREGQQILVVEVDPQGAMVPSLGCGDLPLRHGLTDVLQERVDVNGAIVDTPIEGVRLLPALAADGGDELELERCAASHPLHLREVIDKLMARFDTILLDSPPTLGNLTRMSLAAADSFLVPVQAEEFSYLTLERLFKAVEAVKQELNPELRCEGLLLTMVDLRTRMSVRVVNQLHENYGDKVLMSMVPRTVTLADMPVRGKPTVLYASTSKGGQAYQEVALELLAAQTAAAQDAAEAIGGVEETLMAREANAAIFDERPMTSFSDGTMISSFPTSSSDLRFEDSVPGHASPWTDTLDDGMQLLDIDPDIGEDDDGMALN